MVDTGLWREADSLFTELLELDGAARDQRLAAVDPELRRLVETLLRAGDQAAGILDGGIDWGFATVPLAAEPVASLRGRRLGAYVLDEEIGRGGTSVVYAAHRADGAFEQKVAVKVLGTGLLPTSATGRFRREQQLLARLRHPRIANLLDGGLADDGTPFLVMERIDGVPIDRFCAERRLGARARVTLFLHVCEAVAYAHRHLVVHRDLKPANVLVRADGEVRLLDFGIAKLLEPEPGAEATQQRSRMLTPSYAAPEQIEGGAVTTATDVFGLGRLLAKLLNLDPEVTDGDLVNIAGKATRAEPERRYADARALAADLQRWLEGRPVTATGDGAAYRFRKFLRRRRAAVAAAALVAAVAGAGLAATLWQAAAARREARSSAAIDAFLVDLFHASDPELAQGEDPRASELLRRGAERARRTLAGEPQLESRLLLRIGSIQREIGQYRAAEESLVRALELHRAAPADPRAAEIKVGLALTRFELGRVGEAVALLREALAELERSLPADAEARLDAETRLGDLLIVQGDYEEARDRMRSVLARIGPRRAELVDVALDAEYTLGVALGETGDFEAAEKSLRAVVDEERRRSGGSSRDLAFYLNEYGLLLHERPDYEGTERAYREALAIKRRIYGTDHPQVSSGLVNLGLVLQDLQRPDEALAALEEALAIDRRVHGDRHPSVATSLTAMASVLRRQGRWAEAKPLYVEAFGIVRSLPGGPTDPAAYANELRNYGVLLHDLRELEEAEAVLRESVARFAEVEEGDPVRPALARAQLGQVLVARGRMAAGAALLAPALAELEPTGFSWDMPGFSTLQIALARAELALGERDGAGTRLAKVRDRLAAAEGSQWDSAKAELAEVARSSAAR